MAFLRMIIINKFAFAILVVLSVCAGIFCQDLNDFKQEAKAVELGVQKAISECQQRPEKVGTGITGPLYLKDCNGNRAYVFKKFAESGTRLAWVTTWSIKDSIANEVLAYLIDRFLFGNGTAARYGVPPTYPISIKLNGTEPVLGSAQKYIPDSQTLYAVEGSYGGYQRIAKLDWRPLNFQLLTLNADAHTKNILLDGNDRVYPIDNGLILVGKADIPTIYEQSYLLKRTPGQRGLENDEAQFLVGLNLDTVDARLAEIINYIQSVFNPYNLSDEKRLIFRFGLELAKQFAESGKSYIHWFHIFRPGEDETTPFIKILEKYLPENLIDWQAVKKDFKEALQEQ